MWQEDRRPKIRHLVVLGQIKQEREKLAGHVCVRTQAIGRIVTHQAHVDADLHHRPITSPTKPLLRNFSEYVVKPCDIRIARHPHCGLAPEWIAVLHRVQQPAMRVILVAIGIVRRQMRQHLGVEVSREDVAHVDVPERRHRDRRPRQPQKRLFSSG